MKKQTKTKIGVGSVVKAKVGELYNITSDRRNQEDEEIGGGICPELFGEEEVPIPIRRWVEERDKFFFTCVFKFKRGG